MNANSYLSNGDYFLNHDFPFKLDVFMVYMSLLLDSAQGMNDSEGREQDRRGYLTLMDGKTGEIIFTIPFGEIPEEKRQKYYDFSQEKATRLFSHLSDGHTTSFQSRNEEEQKYGGAIYVDFGESSHILSFSGMPELIDEAMMIVLAKRLSEYIEDAEYRVTEANIRNPFWKKLEEKIQDAMVAIMFSE